MPPLIRRFFYLFRSAQPIPGECRSVFNHLYLDIAWWGVLAGSTASFLIIYATRLGATAEQVGLINAAPAVVALIVTIPASIWIRQRRLGMAVFWTSVAHRIFYLALVFLPWLLGAEGQIWAIIGVTLIMYIPYTPLQVSFQSLFADVVPAEWRGYVAGVRNAVSSITTTITTLVCGYLLIKLPFPSGYQVVFAIGFVGAVMSTVHTWIVQTHHRPLSYPGPVTGSRNGGTLLARSLSSLRLDILRGPFGRIVLLLFFFHFTQYLAIPIFPLFQVNYLGFSDQIIGIGSSLFSVTTFLGSLGLAGWVRRQGNKRVLGAGIILLALYPLGMSFVRGVPEYLVIALVGGLAWALVGGAIYNYLFERAPDNDRPAYLAWYTLGLNAAILTASLLGSALAGRIGLVPALALYGFMRLLAGIAILRWG